MKFGILTISDRSAKGELEDLSGPRLAERIIRNGGEIVRQLIVPDDLVKIIAVLTEWADSVQMDVILTCGGTGFSPRDVTPEATQAVIEKPAPGIAEAIRSESLKITPHAMLSRATAGIRKRTIIINLPGNPKGALEGFEVIYSALPHAVQLLHGDENAEKGHKFSTFV